MAENKLPEFGNEATLDSDIIDNTSDLKTTGFEPNTTIKSSQMNTYLMMYTNSLNGLANFVVQYYTGDEDITADLSIDSWTNVFTDGLYEYVYNTPVKYAEKVADGTTGYSVGSSSNPIYFSDGIPVACANVTAYSATRLATLRTISLSGDATGSVSFNGTENVTISTAVNHSDYSDTAQTLVDNEGGDAINEGDYETPVYISNGTPVACENVAAEKLKTARTIMLSGDVSGSTSFDGGSDVTIDATVSNSVSAKKLVTSSGSNYSVGNYTTPVYFSNGVPVASTAYSRLHLHSTSLTLSTSTYPQYRILWLSESSSSVSLLASIELDAIVGGEVLVSATNIYYGVHVECLLNDSTYTFRWLRWDSTTGAMISAYSDNVSLSTSLAVEDVVVF